MNRLLNQVDTPRRSILALNGCALLAMVLIGGCSPQSPEPADVRLSVGAPGETLADASIDPPYLTDVDGTQARSVAMRFGDEKRFVQRRGQAEIVPTPDPDPKAEIVPTPEGEPVEKMAAKPKDATGSPVSVKSADAFGDVADGPEDYNTWDAPQVALVVTGQQHGYIEPCGCTGLDRQKGGVARRFTFMRQLRDKGWNLLPIDGGNQVRRYGRQAEVKLQQTVKALKAMDYQAIGFGEEDLRLGVGELLSVAAGDSPDDTMYSSSNVVLIDPSLMPQRKVVEMNGMKIGITSVLDPESLETPPPDGGEILIEPMVESVKQQLTELSEANFKVLMFFGKEQPAQDLVRKTPGFDLLVVAGGIGEPMFQAQAIDDSKTKMIVTGNKGMYAGLVGIYSGESFKYARVPLTHEFSDAPEMRQLMKEYQDQLRDIGLGGLGLLPPIPHSSGHKFVGTEKCGECHTTAYDIWEGTPHAEATASIVKPPKERGDIARHFDPECISCHVTGWNPQEYYPYASGYLSLEQSEHLTGNGCENCHGPGSGHVSAEEDESTAAELRDRLRDEMKLPLEKAREKCMKCHDLDNSPDFHEEDAFEDDYWPSIEHYGLD